MIKLLLALILLFNSAICAYSQNIASKDSIFFFPKDTSLAPLNILITSDSLNTEISPAQPEIEKSLRSYWRDEFLNMISVREDSVKKNLDLITNNYQLYSGKTIRNIDIKQLEVFGQAIADPAQVPSKWTERFGNELHINTQEQILKKKLFIHPGDTLNPFTLADNERVIRDLPYIKNVQVIITEVDTDSVDLVFLTKDVFSLGFGLELYDVAYGQSGIWDKNLLGIGHELYYYLSWNYDKTPIYGHKVRYRIQNIGKTLITADASYENQWETKAARIYFNRNFVTPQTKYAGGTGFEKIKSTKDIELPDTILLNNYLDYYYFDLWLGRSVMLSESHIRKKRTNLAITGRITSYIFNDRPDVSETLLHDYHERITLLGSIGFSSQAYYKANLIYGFGKSEDIPYGSLLTITAGLEKNEFYDRPYLGFSYSFGAIGSSFGFLYYRIEYGTFFNNGIEQSAVKVKFKNFSRLFNPEGSYHYRIFSQINYQAGSNRFDDEFLELDPSTDIRGFTSQKLRGNQRLNVNIESVCYSPHYVLGFRFVYFLFLDAGMINYNNDILINNPVYSGFWGRNKDKKRKSCFQYHTTPPVLLSGCTGKFECRIYSTLGYFYATSGKFYYSPS